MPARRLVIQGQVQGVGYRDWMVRTAIGLGLAGWVRNRLDGSVEALVAGPEAGIAAVIALCRDGPRRAIVTSIDQAPADAPAEPGFTRLPTA